MIQRAYEPLDAYLQRQKVLLLYGPRRVGKTTLLENFLRDTHLKYKFDSGDNVRVQETLGSLDFDQLRAYAEGYELIVLDEAQEIPQIGKALKILVDQLPQLFVLASGSSSFEPRGERSRTITGQVGEPLTGRKHTLTLYPIAQAEMLLPNSQPHYNRYELREHLTDFLIYGAYPEVIAAPNANTKIQAVAEIANSYLLKDILAFDRVKSSRTLLDLLRLLAFQIGSEVSLNELAAKLGIDTKTAQRYLDLLEKTFVIQRVGGLSRNLRNEITSKAKYYFYDNGIRNALIAQFNAPAQRNDMGALWENFAFMERLKRRAYYPLYANFYFWRTYDQQEIDLVEERDGNLFGYEFKWSATKSVAPPKLWTSAYPTATFQVITPENYLDFCVP